MSTNYAALPDGGGGGRKFGMDAATPEVEDKEEEATIGATAKSPAEAAAAAAAAISAP